ncbi:MAG: hypothetical protein RJA01_7 [Actinomycetota bacterium]
MKRFIVVLVLALIPVIPANAAPIYTFPVAGCKTSYGKYHHDYPATDIKTKFGCAFVAPINGVVEDVSTKDLWSGKTNLGQHRGGLSISIIGEDGVRYYGSHLSKIEPGIAPGVVVVSGQKLGEVGRTGSARGIPKPHLHFGISYPTQPGDWEIRRGVVAPWRFLDAWKAGKDLSPAKTVARAKAKAGK